MLSIAMIRPPDRSPIKSVSYAPGPYPVPQKTPPLPLFPSIWMKQNKLGFYGSIHSIDSKNLG
jgi:hypothetical protein